MSNPTRKEYDVFISYRRDRGAALARVVMAALEKAGLSVFLDVDEINGRQFDTVLRDTIAATPHFVLLLTAGSLERCCQPGDWVAQEIAAALAHGRHLLVLRDGTGINPGGLELPPEIAEVMRLDALPYTHENANATLDKLVRALRDHPASRRVHVDPELSAMDATLRSPEYQAWQDATLFSLYGAAAAAWSAAPGHHVFPVLNGKRYAIMCFPGALDGAEFSHVKLDRPRLAVRQVATLPDLNARRDTPIPDWVRQEPGAALRSRYFELLSYGRRVRRWNMQGYALTSLQFDAQQRVSGYEAELCTYGENCLTSHLLGYDLYRQYMGDSPQAPRPPLAMAEGVPHGAQFFPLISVQAMLAYKKERDDPDSWTLVAMERGAQVAAAAGFWQFPPAGGFEIYGQENDGEDHVLDQFDMRLALIREFLEEIYGDSEMACEYPDSATAHHSGSKGYRHVKKAIEQGAMHIHFLGVVTELVSLRSEFSFLIVLDDIASFEDLHYKVELADRQPVDARWLKGSSEGKRLNQFSIGDLEPLLKANKVWNPSSIGMLQLLADCSNRPDGWLNRAYPDFPRMRLPG